LPLRPLRRRQPRHHDHIRRRHLAQRLLLADHALVDQQLRVPPLHGLGDGLQNLHGRRVGPVVQDVVEEVRPGPADGLRCEKVIGLYPEGRVRLDALKEIGEILEDQVLRGDLRVPEVELFQIVPLAAADVHHQRPIRMRTLDDSLRGVHIGPRHEVVARVTLHDVVEVGGQQRVRADVLEEDGVRVALPPLEVAVVPVRWVLVPRLLEEVRQAPEQGVRQLAVEAAVHGRQRSVLAEGLRPRRAGVRVDACLDDKALARYGAHHASCFENNQL
ncbi:hypothetical protein CI238_12460, partial [Colletotrichum incanum]